MAWFKAFRGIAASDSRINDWSVTSQCAITRDFHLGKERVQRKYFTFRGYVGWNEKAIRATVTCHTLRRRHRIPPFCSQIKCVWKTFCNGSLISHLQSIVLFYIPHPQIQVFQLNSGSLSPLPLLQLTNKVWRESFQTWFRVCLYIISLFWNIQI